MKKLVFTLALTGFLSAGTAYSALACEGGKCKMEHSDKKGKKAKKGGKDESCQMATAATAKGEKSAMAAPMSCCAKKDAPKAETDKPTKNQR